MSATTNLNLEKSENYIPIPAISPTSSLRMRLSSSPNIPIMNSSELSSVSAAESCLKALPSLGANLLKQNTITIIHPANKKASSNGQSVKALTAQSDRRREDRTISLKSGVAVMEVNTKTDSIRRHSFVGNARQPQRRTSLPVAKHDTLKHLIVGGADAVTTEMLKLNNIKSPIINNMQQKCVELKAQESVPREQESLEKPTSEISIRNITSLKELHAIAAEKINKSKDNIITPKMKTLYKDGEIVLEIKHVSRKSVPSKFPDPVPKLVNTDLYKVKLMGNQRKLSRNLMILNDIADNPQVTLIENPKVKNKSTVCSTSSNNNTNHSENINISRKAVKRPSNSTEDLEDSSTIKILKVRDDLIQDELIKLPITPEKHDPLLQFEISNSPRDKRSKSLNSPSVRSATSAADRRYSSASESKISILTNVDLSSDCEASDNYEFEAIYSNSPEEKINELHELILPDQEPIGELQEIKVNNVKDDTFKNIKVEVMSDENDDDVIEVNKSVNQNKELKVYGNSAQSKSSLRKAQVNSMIAMQKSISEIKMENIDIEDSNNIKIKNENFLICKEALPPFNSTSKVTPLRSPSFQDMSKAKTQSLLKVANKLAESSFNIDSYSSVLDMLSIYNMLTWKERIGSMRGTKLKFELNEFNLLQIHENCPPRLRIHTAYEKPIYDREVLPTAAEAADTILYYCRRCNCHGPADDFLAPEFCSLKCLKSNSHKMSNNTTSTAKKRPRKDPFIGKSLYGQNSKIVRKCFDWSTYLPNMHHAIPAPVDLFLNPFPTGPNVFKIGMKLEAIDPENCSLFCVCTIVDVKGYRLKLTFDGYSSMYDFWVNADSMDIFPPGWCAKTNRILQPPKGIDPKDFNWFHYLTKGHAMPAPRLIFTHLNVASLPWRNPFKIGMHLEAEDLNDTGKLCVATIADVLNDRLRIHFDGWDECFDYWVDTNSPYIHPCGWHEGRQQLIVPPDYENLVFNWPIYIKERGQGEAAAADLFVTREPFEFKPNMKLEVVDPRNPSLIRPATVVGRTRHRVKIHLDCWPHEYCFWLEDDSPDLHPIGWCDSTGHHLEPPPGYRFDMKDECSISGCRGIGNAKNYLLEYHNTTECCPYAPQNWRHKIEKPKRVIAEEVIKINYNKTQSEQSPSETISIAKNVSNVQNVLSEKQKLDYLHKYDKPQRHSHEPNIKVDQKSHQTELVRTGSNEGAVMFRDPTMLSPQNGDEHSLGISIEVAKKFLCDYGPRLAQNYNIWQKNFTFNFENVVHCPLLWNTMETSTYVECVLRNKQIARKFQTEDIDGTALLMLQQSDLTNILGLKLGPAVKLFSHILQLRTMVAHKFNTCPKRTL